MNKKAKILLIVGGCMLGVGLILCGLSYFMGFHGQFAVTSRGKYVDFSKNNKDMRLQKTRIDAFTGIDIDEVTGDIELISSDNYYIEYETSGAALISYSVRNGVLEVRKTLADSPWYLIFFGKAQPYFNIGGSEIAEGHIKIYYPDGIVFDAVKAVSSFGDISVKGLCCNELTVSASYGDVSVRDSGAAASSIESAFGDVYVNGLIGESCIVSLSSGDNELENVNMNLRLSINNDFGDIEAEEIEADEIIVRSSLGDISIDRFFAGKSLSVEADFGDVELSNPKGGIETYNFDLSTALGDVEFMRSSRGSAAVVNNGANRSVMVRNNCGDVEVE